MLASRQFLTRCAVAVVVLFLIAAAFNDHSTTSVDGIIWWVAIAAFGLLILATCVILVGYLASRFRRPRRSRVR